jgi:membrane protease YdiL (CAAX protease family)
LSVLGFSSSWLILKTRRFWPSITLHAIYNFYVMSYPLYQSIFWSD